MAGDEAKIIYRERASTAECVNALARNRGLQRFVVRGLRKVKAVVLWYVLAHNLMRAATLRAAAAKMAVCSG
jgi:IS5 family transposase